MLTVIKNARVLTMDDDLTEYARADVVIRDSKIEALGPDARPFGDDVDRVIDADGKLVMPGITNAHNHTGFATKGVDAVPLSAMMMMSFDLESESAEMIDSEVYEQVISLCTSINAMEMLRNGVTSVHDDAHLGYQAMLPSLADANAKALANSGIRATMALAQTNAIEYDKYPFVKDLLPTSILAEMEAHAAKFSDTQILDVYRGFIDRWHGHADGRMRAGVSISAPERVTTELLQAAFALSEEEGVIFESHCQETKYQRILAQQRYGKSWIAHMDDLGVLGPLTHLNHVVWSDSVDIEILARTGTTVSHNPHSNLFSGTGVMPLRQMLEAGVPVGIGVDETDASGTMNPWEVAKMALFAQHLTDGDWEQFLTGRDLLWCLTRGGAIGMGWSDEIGMLAPGYEADLIMIDLDSIPFAPLNDLPNQLVTGDQGRSVVMTMVAGNIVFEDDRVTTLDEGEIIRAVKGLDELSNEFWPSPADSRLYPYIREMHARVVKTDVGFQRTLDGLYA